MISFLLPPHPLYMCVCVCVPITPPFILCSLGQSCPPPSSSSSSSPLRRQPAATDALTARGRAPRSEPHSGLWQQHTPTNLKHTVVNSSPLSRRSWGWGVGRPWCVCLVGRTSWGVCVRVNECVGDSCHFWWDIERCVCHSDGGWVIRDKAPSPSPWSSSFSLSPSSHLRSLREPSTSPKTVSTAPM